MNTKNYISLLFAMLILGLLYNNSFGFSYEGVTKSFKVNKGGKLVTSISSGDIHINTWSKNEVNIRVDGLDQEDSDNLKITQDGNTINVNYGGNRGWSNDLDFVISLPDEYNLDLRTSGGDLIIRGSLKGEVLASTGGGDISIGKITGTAKLKSNGGDLLSDDIYGDASFITNGGDIVAGDIAGAGKFVTMGGDVRLKNVKNELEVSTWGGDIIVGNVGAGIKANTMGGEIKVGKVTGNVDLSSNGGDLYLKGANGIVNAKTLGGEIKLYDVTGSINANTAAGEIYAELIPSGSRKSSIVTNVGEITLYLPASAKASVYATVKGRGFWGDDEQVIFSDFPSGDKKGMHKKGAEAQFDINGGGPSIELRSVNGEIKIKKMNR